VNTRFFTASISRNVPSSNTRRFVLWYLCCFIWSGLLLTALPVSASYVPLAGISQVKGGWFHTCALTSGGGVKCWGSNSNGQLGDNSTTDRWTPVDVIGLTNGVSAIAAGNLYTCALTTSGGDVKCWGYNDNGQLGDGTTTQRLIRINVSGLASGVSAIATGGSHTCALSGGGVKCCGLNANGQLGDGTTDQSLAWVNVNGLTSGVSAIATGLSHTCALTSGGGMKCWGSNTNGRLGDGSTVHRLTWVDVNGLTSGVSAIAPGGYHTCALIQWGRREMLGT